MFARVQDSESLLASNPARCRGNSGDGAYYDLRCQGFKGDLCGCLDIPAVSSDPYFGCVLSGYDAWAAEGGGDALPLVTLPGVVDAQSVQELDCGGIERAVATVSNCARPPC